MLPNTSTLLIYEWMVTELQNKTVNMCVGIQRLRGDSKSQLEDN